MDSDSSKCPSLLIRFLHSPHYPCDFNLSALLLLWETRSFDLCPNQEPTETREACTKNNNKTAGAECLAHARCYCKRFGCKNVSNPHKNSMGQILSAQSSFHEDGEREGGLRHRGVKQLA